MHVPERQGVNRFPGKASHTRWHLTAFDLVFKHHTIPERIRARQEGDRVRRGARRRVDARIRGDRLYDIHDLRLHDVRRELDPERQTGIEPKELGEDVEEGREPRPGGVVRRGWAPGDVGTARVELDGDAGCEAGVGCAEALDGVEHEAEVCCVGFGDGDDEGFGGRRVFEEGAEPSAGADVAVEGVWGVAV